MKVDILDNDIFASLSPTDIEHYLANTGWRELRRTSGESSIWDKTNSSGNKFRVWVPLDRRFGDYNEGVARLIKTVSTAEDRSQLYLLEDLDTVAIGDIIRIKTRDRFNKASSSILLEAGFTLFNQAQRMTSAAACSTIEKRAVHPMRRPNRVLDYMKKLRIGQSERSSYIIKLISPIEVEEVEEQRPLGVGTFLNVPFERQVVISLMESLDALCRVSNETRRRGLFYIEAYQEGVSEGISANLCEAISLNSNTEFYSPLEVSVTWSYAIGPPSTNFRSYSFEPDVMPYIAEAGKQLRIRNPEDVTLEGYITALRRDRIGDPNIVTLVGEVEGKVRSVRITLSEEAYGKAIHAHENDARVSVSGVMKRERNFFVLANPVDLHIVSTPGRTYQPDLEFD
jgi:hypothetical protein